MQLQFSPYVLLPLLAGVISLAVGVHAWERRNATAAPGLGVLMIAIGVWATVDAVTRSAADVPTALLASRLEYFGIVSTPLSMLVLGLQLGGRPHWVHPRTLLLLLIEPALTLALVWTNDVHHLVWASMDVSPPGEPFSVHFHYGIWFWVHAVYSYLLLAAGTGLSLRALLRSNTLYRQQAALLLVGVLAPWVLNAMYVLRIGPFGKVDLTPVAFSVSGLAFAWSVFRLRFLNVVPVAREAVFEGLGDGVVVISATNHIVDLNHAAEVILGRAADEVVGRLGGDVFARRPDLVETYRNVLDARVEIVLERDAGPRHVEMSISPLRDRRGAIAGRLLLLRDITEHKQMERALAVARDEALEASRLKSEFLATMSHEIRTPMVGVIGMAELMGSTRLSVQQRAYVDALLRSGEAMMSIIDDILDFSKIEAGRLELERTELDVRAVVDDAVGMVSEQASGRGLQVRAVIDEAVPQTLFGDPVRLRQVLMNLLSNAVKFTHEGSVTVSVQLEERARRQSRIRFAVADTGIGIESEARERLFEPFTQADGTTTRRYGGTGLGLAICRRVVQLMGGQIGVDSEPGQGSEFWFVIPLGVAARMARQKLAAQDGPAQGPLPLAPAGLAPILVAEDAPVNQQVARGMLQRLGYRVKMVGNGREAIQAFEREHFAAVLMDCQMPEIDGFTASAEIRRREMDLSRPRTPIIAMTAGVMQGDRERCLAAGMDDYLAKPVRMRDVALKLQRWVSGRRGASRLPVERTAAVTARSEQARPPEGPIEMQAIENLREMQVPGEPNVVQEIVDTFMQGVPGHIEKLRNGAETGQFDELARSAHSLKGSAGFLGMREVRALCEQIEAVARAEQRADARRLVASLEKALDRGRAALEAICREGAA